jgi:preprotein translocase subunit SecG
MTFASIDWLSISINLLLVIFVIVCLLMTLMILMQRPKQEGLGAAFGGGVTDQVFGARTTNVLQRTTVYLGSAFFIISLVLAVLIGHQNKGESLLQKEQPKVEAKAPVVPEASATPKSLTEELPAEVEAPAAPTPSDSPADASEPAPVVIPDVTPPQAPADPPASAPTTPEVLPQDK